MKSVDEKLRHIDRIRKQLQEEHLRNMWKLDNDEREILGLKPLPLTSAQQTKGD